MGLGRKKCLSIPTESILCVDTDTSFTVLGRRVILYFNGLESVAYRFYENILHSVKHVKTSFVGMITLALVFNANGTNIFANKHKFFYGQFCLQLLIFRQINRFIYLKATTDIWVCRCMYNCHEFEAHFCVGRGPLCSKSSVPLVG